jgi:phospholipid/cholesterol/gamma-HCH transport system substrate-binding protein
MSTRLIETLVGLFVAAGLVALGVLAFRVGNLGAADISDGYTVSAAFENIGGLTTKAPVTVAGVRVGRVTGISIDPQSFRAVVELTIERKHDRLPKDTSASILTSGLLGAQYVGLEPGGDSAPLRQGDRILLTQSAVVLEQMLGQLLFSKAEGEKESK